MATKRFDKASGAVIFHHTLDEIKSIETARKANDIQDKLNKVLAILGISEEDLNNVGTDEVVVETKED